MKGNESDYNRPRRPNPDTVSYLRSLPLDVQVATEEVNAFLAKEQDGSQEFPSGFAAALVALEEVRNEIASLAGDEQAAEVLETLVHITAPFSEYAACTWLTATKGYAMFLARHRYGSHLLQTILQQIGRISQVDLAKHEHAPPLSDLDQESLIDLLIDFHSELAEDAADLAVHICGSHVLRSLICVFGGVEELKVNGNPFRRGKSKKKKKDIDDSSKQRDTRLLFFKEPHINCLDARISQALDEMTAGLTGDCVLPPGDLQSFACQGSGALLSILLRVLTYRDCSREEWSDRFKEWEERSMLDHHLGNIRPEPSFEPESPAHLLAKRLLCWEPANKHQWVPDVIYGLAGDPSGSRCLETLLLLSPAEFYAGILEAGDFLTAKTLQEYAQHHVSHFIVENLLATAHAEEQAAVLIDNLLPLVTNGVILDSTAKLRSLLWRMIEASARFDVCQQKIHDAISKGFSTLQNAPSLRIQECVEALIEAKKPQRDGERLMLNVAGARCIHFLLKFDPKLCKQVIGGIVELPLDVLELICKDGLGSRCLIDGLLEGPVYDKVFATGLSRLASKLSSRWVALAVDRIGHHVVRKLCHALKDERSQEDLMTELAKGKKRLSGVSMGRNILDECLVLEFEMKGATEWRRQLKKKSGKGDWLDEMIRADSSPSKKKKAAEGDASHKKKKLRKLMGTDDIVAAISMK
ncbi:hypothetical protein FisN_1Hh527 [Fistulifera solaris]|uniref:Nucleolar protein 9 n=1 Tax=Fistulifera solaris TaxID=1519565 RepID=A0A1Z5JJY9_FISSO|nr:hypothetical protein FisN_1Hh527 [Fistulifera solaris]|eukprot:GAX14327.1 hypothetical protein FisN_1Hh527 [Fistulifera solaris]